MGGSGDEYSYSETNPDGWSSDVWVSYLVVLDKEVLKSHTYTISISISNSIQFFNIIYIIPTGFNII